MASWFTNILSQYISKILGLIPRIIFHSFVPILNSTSTTVSLSLIELTNCDLLITRKGFPKSEKHNASSIVYLPAPFSPTISVVAFLSKGISVKVLPVERKFFQRTQLKFIIKTVSKDQ